MSLLIVGTVGLDTVETPFGKKSDILGGSSVYAAISASFFSAVSIVSVIGEDFKSEDFDFLRKQKINLDSIAVLPGKTFRWSGFYEFDMDQAHTKGTDLNVLMQFDPVLSDKDKKASFVFLANLDPDIQLKIIDQLEAPKMIGADTMDFWIKNKKDSLIKVISKVDLLFINEGEIRMLVGTPNIPKAAKELLKLGVKTVIVKKGEHGALVFTNDSYFALPAYPQEIFQDPTGAGDSFAGGLFGYIAKKREISFKNMKNGIVFGSIMASFNIEDFSFERMKSLTNNDILNRAKEFHLFSSFDPLVEI